MAVVEQAQRHVQERHAGHVNHPNEPEVDRDVGEVEGPHLRVQVVAHVRVVAAQEPVGGGIVEEDAVDDGGIGRLQDHDRGQGQEEEQEDEGGERGQPRPLRALGSKPDDGDHHRDRRRRDPHPGETHQLEDQDHADHVDGDEGEQDALHPEVPTENCQHQLRRSVPVCQPVALDPIMKRIPSRITSSAATSPA